MSQANNFVNIIKMNTQREEVWRYPGRIIAKDTNSVLVEAFFNIDDRPFHGITLRTNDRSIERYYSNRWYNVFKIHDRDDDRLKAWYCNVTSPAEFSPGKITYIDLALDILVYPNGDFLILDEDEFDALDLDEYSRQKALQALGTLKTIVEEHKLSAILKQ
jgi:protein associated with RNAse G/E